MAIDACRYDPYCFQRQCSDHVPCIPCPVELCWLLRSKPPVHAAVFCVDEKSAIQALDRLDPVLPLSPGRAERHGFEYYRHGTLSLCAALNTQTGEVLAKT